MHSVWMNASQRCWSVLLFLRAGQLVHRQHLGWVRARRVDQRWRQTRPWVSCCVLVLALSPSTPGFCLQREICCTVLQSEPVPSIDRSMLPGADSGCSTSPSSAYMPFVVPAHLWPSVARPALVPLIHAYVGGSSAMAMKLATTWDISRPVFKAKYCGLSSSCCVWVGVNCRVRQYACRGLGQLQKHE